MVAIIVGTSIVLTQSFRPPRTASFIAGSVVQGGRPTASADLKAIERVDPQAKIFEDFHPNDLNEAMKVLPDSNPALIYVSSPARVAGDGSVELVRDSSGATEASKLATLIAGVQACPARGKLLILDLYDPPSEDATSGLPAPDLQGAIQDALKKEKSDKLWVLTAASPGERPRMSEVTGLSVFAFNVARALAEDAAIADGKENGDGDSYVSVDELARYVRGRVNDWSMVHFGTPQVPLLKSPTGTSPHLTKVNPPAAKLVAKAIEKSDKPAGAEKDAAKTKDAAKPETVPDYPKSLTAGWARLAAWDAARFYEIAPRPYRRLAKTLRDAERAWRMGVPEGRVTDLFRFDLNQAAQAENDWGKFIALSQPRSLGQARRMTTFQVDQELNKNVLQLAKKVGGDKKPEDLTADWKKLVEDYAKAHPTEKLEESFALANAVIEAAVWSEGSADLADDRIAALGSWLRLVQDEPRFAETAALWRTAAVALRWNDPEIALHVMSAVRIGEQLDADPLVFAKFANQLKQAATLLHRAEVLTTSLGYVSPTSAKQAASAAFAAYEALAVKAKAAAQLTLTSDEALMLLVDSATAVENSSPEVMKTWQEAADRVIELNKKIRQAEASPNSLALREAVTRLREQFSGTALKDLVEKAGAAKADWVEYAKLQAALASTISQGEERLQLIHASKKLAVKLDTVHQGNHPTDPASSETAATPTTRAARAEIARTLLKIAGGSVTPESTRSQFQDTWSNLASSRSADRDVLTRVAPLNLPAGNLDDRELSPAWKTRKEESERLIAWLADRAEFEAKDLGGDVFIFQGKSAGDYRAIAGGVGRSRLIDISPPLSPLNAKTAPVATLKLRSMSAETAKADVRILTNDDSRLKATLEAQEKRSTRELTEVPLPLDSLGLKVEWTPQESLKKGPPLGVLIEVAAGGQIYSVRIPIEGLPSGDEPEIRLIAAGQTESQAVSATLPLRPLLDRQTFAVVVGNPSDNPKSVRVRLNVAGESVLSEPITLKKGQSEKAKFPAPAKDAGELRDLKDGRISISVLSHPENDELAHREFAISVQDPAEYIDAWAGRYEPRTQTDPPLNRLEIKVRQKDLPPGVPKSRVKLIESGIVDRSRSEPKNKNTSLDVGPDEELLFVEGFDVKNSVIEGVFYLDVDDVPRALKFRVPIRSKSGVQEARADTRGATILPLELPEFVDASSGKVPGIEARVDDAPPDAQLTITIKEKNGGGAIPTMMVDSPRNRILQAGVDASGFVLKAGVRDWTWDRGIPGGHGIRVVEAILRDRQGSTLDKKTAEVMFDSEPPRDATLRILGPVTAGADSFKVEASAVSPSGIKRVDIYMARAPKDGKAPTGEPIATNPPGTGPRRFEFKVGLTGSKPGIFPVTARFTNGIGLAVNVEEELRIEAAETKDASGSGAAAMKKPGSITGRLFNGDLAIPNQDVIVKDSSGKEVRRVKTADNGRFTFENLAPGLYKLEAQKIEPVRKASQDVTVEPDKQTSVTLQMVAP